MRVSLNVVAGPQTGRSFTFDQHDTFMIGRSEDAQFCLPHDRFFSRHHCLIEIAPPQAFLRDLGSTNGTFVNGLRADTAHLKSGDRIQGGETVIEVDVPVLMSRNSAVRPLFDDPRAEVVIGGRVADGNAGDRVRCEPTARRDEIANLDDTVHSRVDEMVGRAAGSNR